MWLKPGESKAGNPFELTTRCIHDETPFLSMHIRIP
jgi:hypothetical protein